jgi:hypothetical protein
LTSRGPGQRAPRRTQPPLPVPVPAEQPGLPLQQEPEPEQEQEQEQEQVPVPVRVGLQQRVAAEQRVLPLEPAPSDGHRRP